MRLASTYVGKTPPADWGEPAGEDTRLAALWERFIFGQRVECRDLLDGHDQSVQDLAFHDVTPAEGLVEQGGEVVAGWVEALIVSHGFFRSK